MATSLAITRNARIRGLQCPQRPGSPGASTPTTCCAPQATQAHRCPPTSSVGPAHHAQLRPTSTGATPHPGLSHEGHVVASRVARSAAAAAITGWRDGHRWVRRSVVMWARPPGEWAAASAMNSRLVSALANTPLCRPASSTEYRRTFVSSTPRAHNQETRLRGHFTGISLTTSVRDSPKRVISFS